MITIFGSINMDLVARVQTIARPGETVLSRRAESFFGGKGANQAVAAARMAQGRAIDVAMIGAVGDDAFGRACLDNLRDNGVSVEAIRFADEPTGCAFITVDERGENAITVASGANMTLRAADVPEQLLSQTSVLVLQMEVPFAENLEMALRAKRAGARVVWNIAPVPMEVDRAAMAKMLAASHVLVVNEHEAISVAALMGEDVRDDYIKASSHLARTYGPICVVTAGEKGAVAIDSDGAQSHAAALPVTPVDTTGAGDTFVGVLACSLAEGRDMHQVMRRASIAASLSCLTTGAQAGMPTRERLEQALARGEISTL